jgi:uncharacterized protein (DUF1778 family)
MSAILSCERGTIILACPVDAVLGTAYCQYSVGTTIKAPSKARAPAGAHINLRVRPQVKAVLVQAARLRQVKLTEFMLKSAQVAVEMALADRSRFVLPAGKWREFNAALDAPPGAIPELRKLFSEPSAFGSA